MTHQSLCTKELGLNGLRKKPSKTVKKSLQVQRQKQQTAAAGPYTLSMSFCIDEVNTVVDQYREETGLQDAEMTPEHIAYSVYHGDLIICLKNILIPLDQEWHLEVDSRPLAKVVIASSSGLPVQRLS